MLWYIYIYMDMCIYIYIYIYTHVCVCVLAYDITVVSGPPLRRTGARRASCRR